MLGYFLLNNDGALCLTRYQTDQDLVAISAVGYKPASRTASLRHADGREDVFVDPIGDAIDAALVRNSSILVVHMRDDSTPCKQYKVPIEK